MKSVTRVFFEHLIFFLIFVVILGAANYLSNFFNFSVLSDIVTFFNSNILLLFFLMVTSFIGQLLWNFNFPINLPAPILFGSYGVLIVVFLLNMPEILGFSYSKLIFPISTLVFVVVSFIGYIKIVARLYLKDKNENMTLDKIKDEIKSEISNTLISLKLKESDNKKGKSSKKFIKNKD